MEREMIVKETFEKEGIQEALFLILGWYTKNEVDKSERKQLINYLITL